MLFQNSKETAEIPNWSVNFLFRALGALSTNFRLNNYTIKTFPLTYKSTCFDLKCDLPQIIIVLSVYHFDVTETLNLFAYFLSFWLGSFINKRTCCY